MGKTYSIVFKKNAVSLLNELNSKGFVLVNKKEVKNVRDLVKEIGISRDSMYKWKKSLIPVPETKKEKKKAKKREKEVSPEEKTIELMNLGRELTLTEADAGIIGGRFVGYIAQQARIKGYSKMKLPEMMRKVGQFYLDKSKEGK